MRKKLFSFFIILKFVDVIKDLKQTVTEFFFNLAVPKPESRKTFFSQQLIALSVALHVSFDFWNPKFTVRFYCIFLFFPIVAVPEFAIDKDYKFIFSDNNIWRPGQFSHIFPVSDSQSPQHFPEVYFRLGFFAADFAHQFGAGICCLKPVCLVKPGDFYVYFGIICQS
jgi:hypothetical protein